MHAMQTLMVFFQDTDFSSNSSAANMQAVHMMMALLPVFLLIALAVFAFMIFLYWRIFSKAGMSPWLSLLLFVPFGSIIMQCILAFSEWPAVVKPVVVGYVPPPPPTV